VKLPTSTRKRKELSARGREYGAVPWKKKKTKNRRQVPGRCEPPRRENKKALGRNMPGSLFGKNENAGNPQPGGFRITAASSQYLLLHGSRWEGGFLWGKRYREDS